MMKKAYGMGILGFLFMAAFWGLAEFALNFFDTSLFVMNVSQPLFLFVCGLSAIAYGVYAFLTERKKILKRSASAVA